MPTSAFKEVELSCLPPDERTAVFHSSGTTEQKPSRHFHCAESLAVYEASLCQWFKRMFLGGTGDPPVPSGDPPDGMETTLRTEWGSLTTTAPIPVPIGGSPTRAGGSPAPPQFIFLTPPPEQAPHSSLVHMFETVQQHLGATSVPAGASPFCGRLENDGAWGLDFAAVLAALAPHPPSPSPQPLLILGTAFSIVHLLDFLAENHLRLDLPQGSRVMETGGYKNRSRAMPKNELHFLITEKLGLAQENIICEYGMSELSSQAYDSGIHPPSSILHPRVFHFPPWAWAQIISPETGREVADGETGLIRIFDLANVFSVAAIQTEDLGIRRGEGFELLGFRGATGNGGISGGGGRRGRQSGADYHSASGFLTEGGVGFGRDGAGRGELRTSAPTFPAFATNLGCGTSRRGYFCLTRGYKGSKAVKKPN